jgi:plastocyanin
MGSSTTASSSSTGGNMVLNGCTEAQSVVENGAQFTMPWDLTTGTKCLKVKAGIQVTFTGNFSFHPLKGGALGLPEVGSPITQHNNGVFTLSQAGAYGFFCASHSSMKGAFFVQ